MREARKEVKDLGVTFNVRQKARKTGLRLHCFELSNLKTKPPFYLKVKMLLHFIYNAN